MNAPGKKQVIALFMGAALLLSSLSAGYAAELSQSSYEVKNLSCGSCLARINALVRKYDPRAEVVAADLGRRRVVIEHDSSMMTAELAAFIMTDSGYPATLLTPEEAAREAEPARKTKAPEGSGCQGGTSCQTNCGASSSSWKQLIDRYFASKNK